MVDTLTGETQATGAVIVESEEEDVLLAVFSGQMKTTGSLKVDSISLPLEGHQIQFLPVPELKVNECSQKRF